MTSLKKQIYSNNYTNTGTKNKLIIKNLSLNFFYSNGVNYEQRLLQFDYFLIELNIS